MKYLVRVSEREVETFHIDQTAREEVIVSSIEVGRGNILAMLEEIDPAKFQSAGLPNIARRAFCVVTPFGITALHVVVDHHTEDGIDKIVVDAILTRIDELAYAAQAN